MLHLCVFVPRAPVLSRVFRLVWVRVRVRVCVRARARVGAKPLAVRLVDESQSVRVRMCACVRSCVRAYVYVYART